MWASTHGGKTRSMFSISQSNVASKVLPPITDVLEGSIVTSVSSSPLSEAVTISMFGAEGADGLIGKSLRTDIWFSKGLGLLKIKKYCS